MAKTLKTVFAEAAQDLKVDKALVKRLHTYERNFVSRNEDHVQFFGGHLMGVHPMRFRPRDRDDWFAEVLQIDELSLEENVHALDSINTDFVRASDVMNLSCIWLVYAILNSRLSNRDKESACIDTLLVLQYKFLGSLMAHNYKFPADEATMRAVYASLSYRYALKVAGSWSALLRSRAKDILSTSSIHHRTCQRFEPDKAITYMVTDIQGRLREIVKTMTKVFYEMRAKGEKIGTDKLMAESDTGLVLKDKSKQFTSYLRYLHTVAGDKNSFVRKEVVEVVTDSMRTLSPKVLTDVLNWVSVNHRTSGHRYIEECMDEVLLFAFDLIASNRSTLGSSKSLPALIAKLRGLYMASRMSDLSLLKSKALAERIVSNAVKTRNTSVLASARTGLQLYLVVRTLCKSYYAD